MTATPPADDHKTDLCAPAQIGWWTPPRNANPTDWPYRVVDRTWQGWHGDAVGTFQPDFYRFEPLPYEQLDQQRGPLRHVITPPPPTRLELAEALNTAGQWAIRTVVMALHTLLRRYPEQGGRRLLAGREGSWESQGLREIGSVLGEQIEKAGPPRHDSVAHDAIVGLIETWTGGYPRFYVEVAANLSGIVAEHAQAAGGWAKVCDAQLRAHSQRSDSWGWRLRNHFAGILDSDE